MTEMSASQIISLFVDPLSARGLTLEKWQDILLILRQEKMLARLGLLLQQADLFEALPAQVQRHFNNAIQLASRQKLQVKFEANQLIQSLSSLTTTLVFLKGAGYTLSENAASLGRVFSDIDVLVPKNKIAEVERALAIYGWYSKPLEEYDQAYYRKWAHEIPPVAHGSRGTVLDVHHNLVPLVSGRSLDMEAFITQCSVQLGGVMVLNTPGMFFHSAVHLFFNEEYSSAFRDLNDLYLMYSASEPGFITELLLLVAQFGFDFEIFLAFYYLNHYYQIELPESLQPLMKAQSKHFTIAHKFIFDRVTLPNHSLMNVSGMSLAENMAAIRGHWLKMPLHILLYHIAVKSYRSVIESIFGKHIFTKTA